MAIASASTEFSGGGVTWDEGIIWKVSEGLVGGLGMGLEIWAAAAASTSATAATVLKNAKNKKNDHHLQSPGPVGAKINSTSPPPLSATLDTDAATVHTIVTTSAGSKVGGEQGLGHVASAASHPVVHLVGVLSAFLLLKRFLGPVRFGCRSFKRKVWFYIRFAYMSVVTFSMQSWINWYFAANVSEESLEAGITNRGIGGITLVSVEAHSEGRVGERHPRMPGRGGPGGGGKKANQKRTWKMVTKLNDFIFTLTAFVAWVRVHVGSLAAWVLSIGWVAKLWDRIGKSSNSQPSSGTVGVSIGDDETETGGSAPGSDNEGGGKNPKNNGAAKKGDNSGGSRPRNNRGKNKKSRKR